MIMKSWKQSSVEQDQMYCGTAVFGKHTITIMSKEGKDYMTKEGCVKEKNINILY
jgi:hypothetical protein